MDGATKVKMREISDSTSVPRVLGRRRFLGLGAAALALPLVSRLSALTSPAPLPADRDLAFYNTHSGESAAVEYCQSGCLVPASLDKINHILRDTWTGEVKPIDTGLLDLLNTLARTLQTEEPFHVISGYRSPSTNAYLRTHGGGGVAAHSLHLVGKAVDIRVPGVKLRDLYRTAVGLHGGGVGIYPGSDFVHVDVGRVRTW
jgi:uncharacterized protein YcbK (DUF882 family)